MLMMERRAYCHSYDALVRSGVKDLVTAMDDQPD